MPVAFQPFAATAPSAGKRNPRAWGRLAAAAVVMAGLALVLPTAWSKPAAAVDATSLVRSMMESTAQLVVVREGGARRTGSSVVLATHRQDDRTLLVTAAHVLTPIVPQAVSVLTPLRRSEHPAEVLAVDDEADLALLAVKGLDVEPVVLAPQAMLGDDVYVTAFPWGRRATLVRGMVSQIAWDDADELTEIPLGGAVELIDASVSHGMSGGGIFERESGALVGIVRGYRSAQIAMAGDNGPRLSVPVAGETTVVPTTRILCFLAGAGYAELVPAHLNGWLETERCA